MRRSRVVAVFVIVVLGTWALSVGPSGAQTVTSVTVAATQAGTADFLSCSQPQLFEVTPAQFVLTRSGDTTGELTVALSWSGDATNGTVVSPTSAEFASGSDTTTVTAVFTPGPPPAVVSFAFAQLFLTVEPGSGYEPGDPAAASTSYSSPVNDCILVPPPPPPPPPPPVQVNPSFAG